MYKVLKHNKKTVRRLFPTYEEARHYVRKLIRRKYQDTPTYFFDYSAIEYRTPSLSDYGYSITKV